MSYRHRWFIGSGYIRNVYRHSSNFNALQPTKTMNMYQWDLEIELLRLFVRKNEQWQDFLTT